jgi:hypothetical protein
MSNLRKPSSNLPNEDMNNRQSVNPDKSDSLGNEVIQGPETIKELSKIVHQSKLSKLEELLKKCLKWH